MSKTITAEDRRTLERSIIEHLQDHAKEGFNAHEVYLDSLVDVAPAVGDAEEVTLRDALRWLRRGCWDLGANHA